MGSLNGDIMVMRNGRSTSQVSVYNYPEHLNPFYEDDQHKRLRFWKISKKDSEGRRNSFSIGNLKDMWAFKTFRMKKKSSTLGINKTSESPPLLRRDYALDNGWHTFDHRLRASNTSSINGDSFQRNATYRSSLQALSTSNDRIGLNRNDGYRSTIQVPRSNPRYQTHQKQQQLQQTMGVSQNRRSSQSSMMSANPFESDDDENDDLNLSGRRSVINGSTTTLTSRTPRKKRRAPAPPTPIHGPNNGSPLPTIRIESSHDNIRDELYIKEDIDIANLTAEIESFVKTKSTDDATTSILDNSKGNIEVRKEEVKGATQEVIPVTTSTIENVNTLSKEKVNVKEKINGQIVIETANVKSTANVTEPVGKEIELTKVGNRIATKIIEDTEIKTNGAIPKKPNNSSIASTSEKQYRQNQLSPMAADLCIKETNAEELLPKPVPLKRQTKPEAEVGHVECIHVHVESPKATPRNNHPNGLSSFKTTETVISTETITTKTPFVLTSPPVQRRIPQQTQNGEPIKKETIEIVGSGTVSQQINELNIKEERSTAKPEILAKPMLSPKSITKTSHGFAEIHKPVRRNTQNGHVSRAFTDGSISPPSVPPYKTKVEEEKVDNTVNGHINGKKTEMLKKTQFETVDNLKIVETVATFKSNSDSRLAEEENNEIEETMVTNSTTMNHKGTQKRDDELDFLYRPKPTSHTEWKRSTLAPLETNIPPEKRKSVKDIIESINRSQRLLNAAANKDFPALHNQNSLTNSSGTENVATQQSSYTDSNNSNDLNENLQILDKEQEEFQRLVEELAPSANADYLAEAASCPSPSPSNCNNECTEAQKLDNNEVFQKCKVKKEVFDYRETSPISSNLDWNPVPKPKRTKPGHE